MRIRTLIAALLAGTLTAASGILGADFDGDSRDDIAVFRPSTGLWSVRGVTRVYFGASGDTPSPGDYNGDGMADYAVHRPSVNLWTARGVTRVYFGNSATDEALTGAGSGQRLYDYVVKAGDGADLVAALESNTYKSVFIPNGTYTVSEIIDIDNVTHVVGEGNGAIIAFSAEGYYLYVTVEHCILENFRTTAGGSSSSNLGSVHINADYATLHHVNSFQSYGYGFSCSDTADFVSFVNCMARTAAESGFGGNINDALARYTNCLAKNCDFGFASCRNLSSCTVDGDGVTQTGFSACQNLSACTALDCTASGFGLCLRLSGCTVDNNNLGTYGFGLCSNLSSCHAEGTTGDEYWTCTLKDSESCD